MPAVLIDSSVLIAFLDPNDRHHQRSVNLILNEDFKIQAATISITECLIRPFRFENYFAYLVLENIELIIELFHDLNRTIAFDAARIRATKNLATVDSIILATAEYLNIQLWSCDKKMVNSTKNSLYLGKLD
ncbi:unannotated protein [freshwater metagenome]|uniref:Unannotated protein n=1 Tax=freshwater metagenome TaxID=449393 RepID=A0A6J6KPN3_9ZZZZ|nr:PIN domain-containing protein [Actinomycetota bacterium]